MYNRNDYKKDKEKERITKENEKKKEKLHFTAFQWFGFAFGAVMIFTPLGAAIMLYSFSSLPFILGFLAVALLFNRK